MNGGRVPTERQLFARVCDNKNMGNEINNLSNVASRKIVIEGYGFGDHGHNCSPRPVFEIPPVEKGDYFLRFDLRRPTLTNLALISLHKTAPLRFDLGSLKRESEWVLRNPSVEEIGRLFEFGADLPNRLRLGTLVQEGHLWP
jgi:hypothetical protein